MSHIKIKKEEIEEIGIVEVSRLVFLNKNKMYEEFENKLSSSSIANIIRYDNSFDSAYFKEYGRTPKFDYFMVTKTKKGFHFEFNNSNISFYEYGRPLININNFIFVPQEHSNQFSELFYGTELREIELPKEVDSFFRQSDVYIDFGRRVLGGILHKANSLKKGIEYLDANRSHFNLGWGVTLNGKPYYKTMFVY